MLRYKKWTFVQDEEGEEWKMIEADVETTYYTAFKENQNPYRMCILMLRPFGRDFTAHMAIDDEMCKKAN